MAIAEIRPDWTIGTLNLTSGSTAFTTTGSMLQTAAIQAGDTIMVKGFVLVIATITGQNAGTLMEPCPAGAAGTGQPLRIRFQPDGSRYNGATADLVQLLGSGNVYEFAGLQGVANGVPVFTGAGTMEIQGKDTFVTPDPNGNLAELSGLANVDNLAELSGLELAANKVLTTNDSDELTQSDITAAARVLLKLTGAAATDRMPYFTGVDGAGLTPLTAFARSILDDANGAAMWSTMGAAESINQNGYLVLPNGIIIQWGLVTEFNASGGAAITFPMAFPGGHWCIQATLRGAYNPSHLYAGYIDWASATSSGFFLYGRRITAAGIEIVTSNANAYWMAIGRKL